ncbi:MAG: GAF domain-containing protein, partial [Deltaproteobacteria bacterium]|nr:GAF domain-containing protein [Deltaproteobacteria bacterium]
MLEKIVDAAIELSGAERGFIVLAGEGDSLSVRAARNIDHASLTGAGHISRSIALTAMDLGKPVVSINAQDDERFREYLSVHNLKLRSVLCLPLAAPKGVLGALYLDNRFRVSAFSDADVALLSAFGDQAAIALANARLVDELTRRSEELLRSRAAIEELNARLSV